MGTGTRLKADHRRRQVGEERQHLPPLQLLAQYRLAGPIDAMHLKHLLCEVLSNPEMSLKQGEDEPVQATSVWEVLMS